MKKHINRWVILFAGIIIQTILGGIYAWSTFTPWLVDQYALSKGQSGLIFGLTIGFFTVAMILAGRILSRKGPRLTAGIGAVLFMSGYLLSSVSNGSFIIMLISLGLITGAGIGFGYVCPLSVGMKWFPNKKGLVTGIAVAGFGGGAVLLSSVAEYFLHNGIDVLFFFRFYGIIAGIILFIAAMFLDTPEKKAQAVRANSYSSILTAPFALIALGLFSGTFAGLLIIGNLSPLVLDAGFTEAIAVLSISIFAIGNALGRMTWGHTFDYLGYKSIPLSLASFAVFSIFLLLPLAHWLFLIIVGLLGFGFGSNFVVYASAVSDYFGVDSFPEIYPVSFLAYGIAGIIGPGIGGFLADTTGSYTVALYISIAIVLIAAALTAFNLKVFKYNR